MFWTCCYLVTSAFCRRHQKALTVNGLIICFLISYTLIGGFIFLHFEHGYHQYAKHNDTVQKRRCIETLLTGNGSLRAVRESDFARTIAERCLSSSENDPRLEWSYKTAALYGFGILTTLGYGKVEPKTLNGRIFTVIYGFIGIPLTVILLTNIGRYLETGALKIRRLCLPRRRRIISTESITGSTLMFIVVIYLALGAVFVPLMQGQFDFFNGLYFAFICLTAIEYGDLVPENNWYVPLVVIYVSIGLAISTIALDIGSLYVRKLHYIGRKLKNIAKIRIWFGAKDLEVQELITAVGQNIGLGDTVMQDIDIDTLVKTAILVKKGLLPRVPQTLQIVEGIWPPELVPLFMKDGQFPLYVDSEDDLIEFKPPKRTVVRFEDEVTSDIDDTLTSETTQMHSSRLSPVIPLSSVPPLRSAARRRSSSLASSGSDTLDDSQTQ